MKPAGRTIKREELYEAVWARPIKQLVQEWNTTYLQIVRACEELEVPRPGPGHWQFIARGVELEKEVLPERKSAMPKTILLVPPKPHSAERASRVSAGAISTGTSEAKEVASASESAAGARPPTQPSAVQNEPAAADNAVLDIIRQARRIDFWRESIAETFYPRQIPGGFKRIRKDYDTFEVSVDSVKDQYTFEFSRWRVTINLKQGFDWKDAWEEAWRFSSHPNPHCLSDNALRLFQWAKGPKNTQKLIERRKIGAQARLRDTYLFMEDHLREIRLKADSTIRWEKDKEWHRSFRIWFELEEGAYYQYGPLNPALSLNLRKWGRSELETFRSWFYGEVIKPTFPSECEVIGIIDCNSRKQLMTIFSSLPDSCGNWGELPDFFQAVHLMEGLELRHRFDDGGEPWLVICKLAPDVTWTDIKSRLATKAQEIPLEKRYQLSDDALSLLRWIVELRSNEYQWGITPSIEDHLVANIGFKEELDKANVGAYVEILIEQINERSDYLLKKVDWQVYAKKETRLFVRKKPAELDEIVRRIQFLALKNGRMLGGGQITAVINQLLNEN